MIRLRLLVFLLAATCQGQLPSISFETITLKDGLPSSTVYFATKDRQGFMWFGTRLCPTRYDGVAFRSFFTPETNLVNGIAADNQNKIWIAGDRSGLCTVEPNSLKMQSVKLSLASDVQTGHFFIDSYAKGWYADQSGVNQVNLKTRKVKHYGFRQTTYVWLKGSFAEDAERNLWVIGTDNGLFRYDRQRDTLICVLGADCADVKQNEPFVFSKGCVDAEGILWMGSYNHGLVRYDPKDKTYKTFEALGSVTCVSTGQDENGKPLLWVGTPNGLAVFRPEQQRFYTFPSLFADAYTVYHIFRDADNDITWVCTSEGILKYNPQSNQFHQVQLPVMATQVPVMVNVIVQDQADSNVFWLGLSHGGLMKWNKQTGQFQAISLPGNLQAPEIRWMVQRADGTLWMGVNRWDYQRGGLFVYSPQTQKFVHPLLVHRTRSLFSVSFFMYGFFDKKQRLWIGNSDEGIHVFDEKTGNEVTPWPTATQKQLQRNNNLINDMHMDRQGNVWLATYQGVYYADEANRRFVNMDSVANHPVLDKATNSVYEDHNGNLWSARWGNIAQMTPEGKMQTVLSRNEGLYDRENSGIAEDELGNVWIGNFEGLHCYNPRSKRLLRFTLNDGLMQNNTLRRVFTSRDGKLLFVGQKGGFNFAYVANLFKKATVPPLAISSFLVHDQPLEKDFSKPIRLKRSDNAFSANFIALNYGKIQNNQYAYFLEGFDKTWKYSGSQHLAYYTNLDPGSYVLHLKAGDAFGNWNPREVRLSVTILPAYYETWWFRMLAGMLVLAALYALYRYRVQQLLRLQRVRNRISADLHDEIGSSLSGISIMGLMAKQNLQDQHPSATFLNRMIDEVHRINSSMDDIVWSINPRNDELANLLSRMVRYASELLEAKNIDYQIQMPDQVESLKLGMEQRHDFYLIFKEAVNNLAKYAQCTQARLSVSVHHNRLVMNITDNGTGFELGKNQERNGIRNMYKRAENLKGVLTIHSAPGNGTTINLDFPLG